LQALALAAVQDGIVTDAERRDLNDVAELLGYDAETLNGAIESARATHRGSPPSRERERSSRESFAGMTVCFTGESRCMLQGAPLSRVRAEELAREAGLVVKSSVTKNLQLLVVADPDSLSGKARKAHDYGIRVVAEAVFWQILGIEIS
jgi:DNA polymerase-3 subunit epsilon